MLELDIKCEVCSSSEYERRKLAKLIIRKNLILKELSIGIFMIEYSLPALETFLYHINYVFILSKHIYGNMRKEACLSVPRTIYQSEIILKDYMCLSI